MHKEGMKFNSLTFPKAFIELEIIVLHKMTSILLLILPLPITNYSLILIHKECLLHQEERDHLLIPNLTRL
jgi:hypothetical protein